ncbi:MAG: glycosyltransferase family 87 protein [Candidatus Limnocylindrales bacterium]
MSATATSGTMAAAAAVGVGGWPFRVRLGPLALPPRRVRLWGVALAIIGLVPIDTALLNGGSDWPAFWAAGATVGTPDLVNGARHSAWQVAHGVATDYWRYPPAVAYAFAPLSHLPIWAGFVIQAALMLALVGVAGLLLARIFELPASVTLLLAFAWTPTAASADIGQNATIAVVLALWTIDALRRDSSLEAGLAAGLMLYKPTLGLPLVGLLLLRGRWRSLAAAGGVGVTWYLVSVVAAAGDWGWPISWWNGMQPWLAPDLIHNADKAISLPGLLGRLPGVPLWLPVACGAVMALLALPGLVRAPIVEAGSAACLLAMAAGPRVWGYEAGLLLPILAWASSGGLSEPWRTRLVYAAVPLGLLWLVSAYTVVSGVAIIVLAAAIMWLWRWRPGHIGGQAPFIQPG